MEEYGREAKAFRIHSGLYIKPCQSVKHTPLFAFYHVNKAMNNTATSNEPNNNDRAGMETEIKLKQIDQLSQAVLQFSKNTMEVKKLCTTVVMGLVALYFKFPPDKIPQGIVYLLISFVIFLFWNTDAYFYYNQKNLRRRISNLEADLINTPINHPQKGGKCQKIRNQIKEHCKSHINRSQVFYLILFGGCSALFFIIKPKQPKNPMHKKDLPKVFISYTTQDKTISPELLTILESTFNQAFNLYIDILHNNSTNKQARVMAELKSSDIMLILITKSTLESNWVRTEINTAIKNNIPILKIKHNELLKLIQQSNSTPKRSSSKAIQESSHLSSLILNQYKHHQHNNSARLEFHRYSFGQWITTKHLTD